MKTTALLGAALLASACSSTSATQAFLEINAAGDARSAPTVRLRVSGGLDDDLTVQRIVDLEADGSWPLEISIEPMGGDASRRWRAEAWAMADGPCLLQCATSTCLGAKLMCSSGACEASCADGSAAPNVTCNGACSGAEC